MFNGYNDTPLISYEFNQERVEKKHESVPKWSPYGHDAGVQPAQAQPNNRHPEFWTGKSNFLGIPNVVKCNCTGCYPSSEKQSYQGDTSRHRPWLPRTFPVPVNGSNEPCKLPACQWDNLLSNQGSCYPESGLPYVQENGGKYSYYKHHQNSRLAESNQPGVITSVKNAEYAKKSKSEMRQDSPVQNGTRQPVFCNPAYSLAKRVDGRNYCEPIEKYSNVASYSVEQHIPRLPVVEPFTKAVPSNLSQSRVPSTGYRSVKENMPQSYVDLGFGDARKICQEEVNCEQRSETFSSGQLQAGAHTDFSHFNAEVESQKLFLENTRHSDYYSRNNFQDVNKRNNQSLDTRKDCAMHQINEVIMSEQHYNIPRSKHQEVVNAKTSCDVFYPKEFDKTRPESHLPANPACFQRSEDAKNESMNVHARLPPSALLFNDSRFADRTQDSFTCQSNPVPYRNYIRPEYPYQSYNTQARYEYPGGLQRNDVGQYRVTPQQIQTCEQLPPQQGTGFVYDPHYQLNSEKAQQAYRGKNPSPVQAESQTLENRNPPYLEAIRSEELSKNGTSKISPLRLLRKKKFINVPQEPAPPSTLDALPGLDVRKFWSTWAEEEEENVAPTQMVVLDCQNIDPEQAKLLHLYDTDPLRSIHVETSNTVIKNADFVKESVSQTAEEVKTREDEVAEPKVEEQETSKDKTEIVEQDETEKIEHSNSAAISEPECHSEVVESVCQKTSQSKQDSNPMKKVKSGHENRGKKKPEIMDKWTEKKFDFLKRAEESKAAEILRHEEEKKKIFQTRLSLQQSLKKCEKPQEKSAKTEDESGPERLLPFDENSRSDSPEDMNGNADNLPTCEYRRNKFLDYSDRKVVLNGEDRTSEAEDGSVIFDEPAKLLEVKKEENQKLEYSDQQSTDKFCPLLNPEVKVEAGVEMDDILQKMSEINFRNSEIKLENGLEHGSLKKLKSARKLKKRKSDHQPETEERTDKLTVETVTKPTIKFSIQKSHDLKISFKVLNSSKEYSDEEMGDEGAEDEGKADEESKNSTELITLKYKSIKRDGERRQLSDLKKCRKAFRRKKQTPKTPVLKIKKSRYMPQEERDPLADDDDDDTSDKCSVPDGFQVKETMDSAKIKLTFKRHKGNFETEYKINNLEKLSEVDATREEMDEHEETTKDRCRKKSRRGKKQEIFAEAGVENFQNYQEPTSDSNGQTHFESILEDDSRNSTTSRDSYTKDGDCDFQSESFSELPSDPQLAVRTPENEPSEERLNSPGETQNHDGSKWSEETSTFDQEPVVEFALGHVNSSTEETASEENRNGDEFPQLYNSPCPDGNVKRSTPAEVESVGEGEEKTRNFEKEENQEISLDFIRSTKSQEIELRHNLGKTVEGESVNVEKSAEELQENHCDLESKISETEDSSCTLNSVEDDEVTFKSPKITDDAGEVLTGLVETGRGGLGEGSEGTSTLPSLDLEEENCMKTAHVTPEETNEVVKEAPEPFDEEITSENENLPGTDENSTPVRNTNSHINNSYENLEKIPSSPNSPELISPRNSLESEKPKESVRSFQISPKRALPEDDVRNSLELLLEKSTEHGEKNAFECAYLGPTAVQEDCSNEPSFFENSDMSLNDLETTENSTAEAVRAFLPTVDPSENVEKTVQSSSDLDTQVDAQLPEVRTPPGKSHETTPEDSNYLSTDAEQSNTDKHRKEYTGEDEVDTVHKPEGLENVLPSPKANELQPSPTRRDSGCLEVTSSLENINQSEEDNDEVKNKIGEIDLPLNVELEDGEIVDSPSESQGGIPEKEQKSTTQPRLREDVDFVARKIERRHSINPEKITWSRRKFSKAKSCPPQLTFTELQIPEQEMTLYIPVESIPLPLGPHPYESCFDFIKYINQTGTHSSEAKDKPKESSSPQRQQKEIPPKSSPHQSPIRSRHFSPPVTNGEEPSQMGLLQRSSKIKFSFLKRSKFSKISVKSVQDLKPEVPTQARDETKVPEKQEDEVPDSERKEQAVPIERNLIPKECQIEEVPKPNVPDGVKEAKSSSKCGNEAEPVGLSCEDLEESVEVIDTMTNFIRDEFYECEDIPTSEDLTNGEDPEIEKVNDDKFRNIMQNCLDNAKKFLNVGNLKLFSCSVDDLLELDCQEGSDSSLGENEPEKPTNHISRDVLLTSCEDANEELGLSENVQPSDISMDFVPSFCSDVCPEILPVDNWPYLEEEVPSSPTKTKVEETDLIPTLENSLSCNAFDGAFFHRNGTEHRRRKRVASETSFKRFRRKSLLSDGEAFRMCSKIGVQRRKTIESLTGITCGRDILDIKDDMIRLKSETGEAESKSLKCRLSLDKITNRHGIGFRNDGKEPENGGRVKGLDYRSPVWQPKVMLFRISKNELRKVLKSSKSHRRFASKSSDDSAKRKISSDLESKVSHEIKKLKSDPDIENLYVKPVQEFEEVTEAPDKENDERVIDLSRLDSIKGSLTSADPEARKRKKSRFRNLHTKRKTETDAAKDINPSALSATLAEPTLVDAEIAFAEIFRDCDRLSDPQVKNTNISIKDDDHRSKKKSEQDVSDSRVHVSSKNERRSQNETETTRKSKEEWKHDKHRERKHDHRDRRSEKSEGREHGDRHRESESRKHSRHGSSHDSSRHQGKRSPGGSRHSKKEHEPKSSEKYTSEGVEKKWRHQRETTPEASWVCEVCGFNDASERVVHIKSHPFHCQSCHLAFKTETHFIRHLTKRHKDIRNQHHCLLCELSFDTEDQYQGHLETREHRHLESVEKNTINTLFTLLTGAPCPVFGLVEMRPEWLPNQAGTVHFYHQATPLSLALQYLKMHHDLSSFSTQSSAHPK